MKIYGYLLGLLCVNIHISAQQVYTLEQCRQMALGNNKSAAIAAAKEQKTGYDAKAYYANFFPKITASGMYLYTNSGTNYTLKGNYLPTFTPDLSTGQLQPNLLTMPDGTPITGADGSPVFREYAYFPDMSLDVKMNGTYFAGIRAEQPLYAGGKIASAYRMSRIGQDIAKLNTALTRNEIIVETDEAYWQHVKALESQKAAQAFSAVVNELLRNVENAVSAGMKTRNDALKVQVQVNRAELQLQQAANAIRLSRMNLCRVIGLPVTAEIAVETLDNGTNSISQPLAPDLIYSSRPEYAILEKQIELKNQQVKLVRSDFLPNVGLMANYGYMRGPELNGSPLVDRASFAALLTVSIPVFHWGEGWNRIRAAKAEKQIMQLQRDDLNEKMTLELQQALDRCAESAAEVRLTARALEQAEENLRASRDHYEAGMETLADYLEAQTLWQQAWLDNINAIIKQRLNDTYRQRAAGEL
ncbi:MAG: TolC family protein [Tannerella sp.]|jgi:outer membrane protein TolC|nr:TolC family protein [Tannerella sp.]